MIDDVLVIGGGAAGLAAAGALAGAGCRVRLIEARARLGGRIHTIRDPLSPVPLELGAEFVHGTPAVTFDRLDGYGLSAYEMVGADVTLRDGTLHTETDFFAQVGRVMEKLDDLPDTEDRSFTSFLQTHASGDEFAAARRAACAFVEGFDAADPDSISTRALSEEWAGLGDVEAEPQYRLTAGYGALIEAMTAQARTLGATFHLGTKATAIRWRRGYVAVDATLPDGSSTTFEARRAVVTLPLPFLSCNNGEQGGPRFEPDVDAVRAQARRLEMGPVVKVLLLFRSPFWTKRKGASSDALRELSFLLAPEAPLPTFWTTYPVRSPVLTAWAGGPKAAALSGKPPNALIRLALETLSEAFGEDLSRELLTAHTADWLRDPFAAGAYSYVGVGGSGAHAALAEPVEETLYFAGEHVDTTGQASTVAGALASGTAAAQRLLRPAA